MDEGIEHEDKTCKNRGNTSWIQVSSYIRIKRKKLLDKEEYKDMNLRSLFQYQYYYYNINQTDLYPNCNVNHWIKEMALYVKDMKELEVIKTFDRKTS